MRKSWRPLRGLAIALACWLGAAAGSSAAAQETGRSASAAAGDIAYWFFPDWHVYGRNTWRTDVYKSKGNLGATPYRYSNAQSYDELNLNLDRSFTPFNRVSVQLGGLLYNDSAYRSPFSGGVLERLSVHQENGDFVVPYRADVGDFFAFQSYRTIQRSLKGGRIELQPRWGGAMRHSIELFNGTATPNWDTFQYKDDFSTGASWLVTEPRIGALAANLVVNHKQANGLAQPALRQYVYSLAWEKRAAILGQRMVIEAEAGRFVGDHPLVVAGTPNKHRQGNGIFGQISGTFDALPQLSYRLRGEAYEQDYMPNGASIQSDRNSQEGYLTWRTATGLAFSTRLQHYHTGWQTSNPTDTITYDGNISGTIPFLGGIAGSIDAFVTDVESRDLATNTIAKVANLNLSKSIDLTLALRGGFYYANNRDKNNPTTGRIIQQQYSIGADIRSEWRGISGVWSPGAVARRFDQQGVRRWEYNPTLNADFSYGAHRLSLALARLDQEGLTPTSGVNTITAGLNYRYTQPKYTIGLDADWYDRKPDNAAVGFTHAWRIGAYFTYNFDRPPRQLAMAGPETVSDVSPAPTAIERMLVDVTRLRPGMAVDDAEAIVAQAGLGAPAVQAGYRVWYAAILRDLSELNQRLALEAEDGRVERTAVIIDFAAAGDAAAMQRTFERVRRQLLEMYGQPTRFFEQGDFTAKLAADLASGRFIRTMEWRREGGVLRFGIPRRLDGRMRMELQFARSFPDVKETLWSLDPVQ